MGNYSKVIAAVIGFALSFVVTKFSLPVEWSSPEVATAVSGGITSILVYFFPANKPA